MANKDQLRKKFLSLRKKNILKYQHNKFNKLINYIKKKK